MAKGAESEGRGQSMWRSAKWWSETRLRDGDITRRTTRGGREREGEERRGEERRAILRECPVVLYS
jgi:hypothetical protein